MPVSGKPSTPSSGKIPRAGFRSPPSFIHNLGVAPDTCATPIGAAISDFHDDVLVSGSADVDPLIANVFDDFTARAIDIGNGEIETPTRGSISMTPGFSPVHPLRDSGFPLPSPMALPAPHLGDALGAQDPNVSFLNLGDSDDEKDTEGTATAPTSTDSSYDSRADFDGCAATSSKLVTPVTGALQALSSQQKSNMLHQCVLSPLDSSRMPMGNPGMPGMSGLAGMPGMPGMPGVPGMPGMPGMTAGVAPGMAVDGAIVYGMPPVMSGANYMAEHVPPRTNPGIAAPYADLGAQRMMDPQHAATQQPRPAVGGAVGANVRPSKSGQSKSAPPRRYKIMQPSKFCHVCVRSGELVTLAPCANVISGVCRKAICRKCFEKHGHGSEWEQATKNHALLASEQAAAMTQGNTARSRQIPDTAWQCLHCRKLCPDSAQCKIYARTNRRRHLMLKQRKAEKVQAMAARVPPGQRALPVAGRTTKPLKHSMGPGVGAPSNTSSLVSAVALPEPHGEGSRLTLGVVGSSTPGAIPIEHQHGMTTDAGKPAPF